MDVRTDKTDKMTRRLSMDDLDKVTGGGDSYFRQMNDFRLEGAIGNHPLIGSDTEGLADSVSVRM